MYLVSVFKALIGQSERQREISEKYGITISDSFGCFGYYKQRLAFWDKIDRGVPVEMAPVHMTKSGQFKTIGQDVMATEKAKRDLEIIARIAQRYKPAR